jgi:hypothetical protein
LPRNICGSQVRGPDLYGRDEDIAALWDRLRQTRLPNVRALIGGSVNIEPTLERLGKEALINDLDRHRLEGFPRGVALRFIADVLAAEGVAFDDGVPRELLDRVDSGVPFFLQVALDECRTTLRRRGSHQLTRADVDAALEQTFGAANRSRFRHYVTRLKEHYRELEEPARVVLAHLVSGPADEAVLVHVLQKRGWGAADLGRLLGMLEADYYVVHERTLWSFAHGFLREWWRRNGPVSR